MPTVTAASSKTPSGRDNTDAEDTAAIADKARVIIGGGGGNQAKHREFSSCFSAAPMERAMTATPSSEPSVDDLRREAERTRAGLTGTVEELRTRVSDTASDLRERVSPAAIKAEVKEYVRDSKEQLFHTLERKARENPLQAVAIGAGLAYPIFNILRALPAPVMLIGAGILLARRGAATEGQPQRPAAPGVVDAVRERAQGVSETLQRSADQAGDAASGALRDAKDYVRGVIDPLAGTASDTASSLKNSITDAARDASTAVQKAGTAAFKTGSDAFTAATEQALDLGQKAKDSVGEAIESNPLLVAGVGLAIGAFIAASLPPSDAENRMFGETRDALKDQAERAAAQGIEAAKGIVGGVSTAAAEEGVSVDGLASVAGGLTDKLRAVADRGLTAALGSDDHATKKNETRTEAGLR